MRHNVTTALRRTRNPECWMMAEVCICIYALHVMLVDDHNRRKGVLPETRGRQRSTRGDGTRFVPIEPMDEKGFRSSARSSA